MLSLPEGYSLVGYYHGKPQYEKTSGEDVYWIKWWPSEGRWVIEKNNEVLPYRFGTPEHAMLHLDIQLGVGAPVPEGYHEVGAWGGKPRYQSKVDEGHVNISWNRLDRAWEVILGDEIVDQKFQSVEESVAYVSARWAPSLPAPEAPSKLRELMRLAKEVAQELEYEIDARYGGTQDKYPSQQRKYERDMSTIVELRDLLDTFDPED